MPSHTRPSIAGSSHAGRRAPHGAQSLHGAPSLHGTPSPRGGVLGRNLGCSFARNLVACTALSCIAPFAAAQTTTVTFSAGAEGWISTGGATTLPGTGGNPDANLRTVFNNFGLTFVNSANPAFRGDFTTADSVTIAIDVRVENIAFFGSPVSRPWLVELRDTTNPPAGYPWKSVWFLFAPISAASTGSWTTFSVTFDPRATALPPGWGGYGAETAGGEPILPPGTTFRDVLAGVDAMAFTTLQPGFVFGFTDFTVRLDNIRVTRTVAPRPGDLNGDGAVDAQDIAVVLSSWGACPPKGACAGDVDGDGDVDAADVAAVLSGWTG